MVNTAGAETQATRSTGWKRLEAFLPYAQVYEERRSYVEPPLHRNVSGLSPWLQKRLVLEEEVVVVARARWGFQRVEKFIQETYWRTYWKDWLEQRPGAWERWREAVPRRRDELTAAVLADYEAAVQGKTDIACFNAWAREMCETGWLHNHARMWFASIWIFTLRLPWELGAAFFQEHLLDGDAASNTLSWRWVAGLHTPGKTYLARTENIARYSGSGYAPAPGRLASEAFLIEDPPLAKVALAPRPTGWRETGVAEGPGAVRAGLWLHPEDLCAEVGGLADAPVKAIFAAWPRGFGARAGWSPAVEQWTRAALSDGGERAGRRFQCEVEGGEHEDLAESLAAWARAERLAAVLAHEPMTGPWRPEARAAEAALGRAGVSLLWIRRSRDDRLWPHATRGFFSYWEAVKREQGLS
jgi:deoxyribodipyrimidine photo-lyase